MDNVTANEIDLLDFVTKYGRAAYPISKVWCGWSVETDPELAPCVLPTKREAVAYFERVICSIRSRMATR